MAEVMVGHICLVQMSNCLQEGKLTHSFCLSLVLFSGIATNP